MDKFSELKEALEWIEGSQYGCEWDSALIAGAGENHYAVTNGDDVVVRTAGDDAYSSLLCDYIVAVSPSNIRALLAELEREIEMRAHNLEIKALLAEKVKGLETKLWDSQQLVDAKSSSQIELRSQISSIEESNRKDMAWRGERLCELGDSLEAAQERIAELERANQSQDDHISQQQDRIDSLEKTNAGLGRGLAAAINRLLDSDGSRGCFSAVRSYDAREEIERLLAQPVSQGYTLPEGWRLVPIDATRAMIDAAQRVEEDGYDAMHKAMLAAAPEGGNDPDTRR